ncbi:MAG TPA: hypothetical protein VNE62_06080 [Actinomycetota bacterium]|nr:hypothetical protein [Actinomycetota bacterium]
MSKVTGGAVLESLEGSGKLLRKAWAERVLEWLRAVLKAVVDRVVVPVGKGAQRFDPGSVEIRWLA